MPEATPRQHDAHLSDLIAVLGDDPPLDLAARLADRPGLGSARVEQVRFPWGRVFVQTTFGGPPPAIERGAPAFVGRAVVRASKRPGDATRAAIVRMSGGLLAGAETLSESLSGMFAAFEFDDRGIRVLTDRMGFRPVYVARDAGGRVRSLGTHAETVAEASGTGDRIDAVSVAELLVHNDITFPYTTRETMRELPPASITTIDGASRDIGSRVLWEPLEPDSFPPPDAMRHKMRDAMLEAGQDLTRGCERIGVLLSGGADSRAVLGAVLAAVNEPARVTGLTYVTRENNETAVAARVAAEAGCRHEMVRRDEHYFPRMLGRGLALLGCELRGNCHGLGVADNSMADRFDVVIGGQLSDTMLKDHFVDITTRARLRPRNLKQRVREIVPGLRRPLPVSPPGHTTGRAQLEPMLTEAIRERVRERRAERLREVQRVRPETGAVWHRFWPGSRQDDSAHTLGNARIMAGDTLFAHTAIVEAASELSLQARIGGVPANRAIVDVCGPLACVENANTGLPIDAPDAAVRRAKREKAHRAATPPPTPEDRAPWNAVETSWVDPKVMQQRSPEWVEARRRLEGSEALGFLDTIVGRGGASLIGSYQEDLPSNINHIAVQIAVWLDGVLAGGRGDPDELEQPAAADSR